MRALGSWILNGDARGVLERSHALWKVALTATLLTATACAATSASVISSDPTRIDITCKRALGNCYERALEECPNGFTVVGTADQSGAVVSTYGSVAVATPIYNGEMIVECKTEGATVREAAVPSTSAPRDPPERDAPSDAAGFAFGASLETSRTACENSGLTWKEGKGSFRCTGTPVDTGLGAEAQLRFCKGELCKIELVVRPSDGDAALTATRIEKVVSALRSKYGAPTTHDVAYGADCTGAALPTCLQTGTAHFWYQWKWEERQKITLWLGSRKSPEVGQALDPAVVTTIRIRYDDGRTPDAPTGAPASHGSTTPGAVNGL